MSDSEKKKAWKAREETLVELQEALLEDLLVKLESGEATHQDKKLTLDLLKHNDIDAYFDKEVEIHDITKDLPFRGPDDNLTMDDLRDAQ